MSTSERWEMLEKEAIRKESKEKGEKAKEDVKSDGDENKFDDTKGPPMKDVQEKGNIRKIPSLPGSKSVMALTADTIKSLMAKAMGVSKRQESGTGLTVRTKSSTKQHVLSKMAKNANMESEQISKPIPTEKEFKDKHGGNKSLFACCTSPEVKK